MIFCTPGRRADFQFAFCEGGRGTPMMVSDQSTRSLRAILFLIVSFGLPGLGVAATLEDFAKEFAQKIAAELPPQENCVLRDSQSVVSESG